MSRTREVGLRERIVETAMAVFGAKGFQATTLKDIAEGAGISTGTVYTYFQDKEDLFSAAFDWGWQRFCEDLEELSTSHQSFEARLESLLGSGLETLAVALPALRGMLFDATAQAKVKPAVERVIDAIDRILDPYFEGLCPPGDSGVRRSRRALIGIFVTGILFSAAFTDGRRPEEEIADLRLAMQAFFGLLDWKDGTP